jgi:hypothetical protein
LAQRRALIEPVKITVGRTFFIGGFDVVTPGTPETTMKYGIRSAGSVGSLIAYG